LFCCTPNEKRIKKLDYFSHERSILLSISDNSNSKLRFAFRTTSKSA